MPIQGVKLNNGPQSFNPQIFLLQRKIILTKKPVLKTTIFSILFSLNGEEERINVQKERILFMVWKIILMESFREKMLVFLFFSSRMKKRRQRDGASLCHSICVCTNVNICVWTHTYSMSYRFLLRKLIHPSALTGKSIKHAICTISLKSIFLLYL